MSQLKGKHFKQQEPLTFIRHYTKVFKQYYQVRQAHKSGLPLLYFIQGNEEFEEKMFDKALQSCELSIEHCQGVKNEPHLLKVEFLKSKLYAELGQRLEESKAIKKCQHYANLLTATTGD